MIIGSYTRFEILCNHSMAKARFRAIVLHI